MPFSEARDAQHKLNKFLFALWSWLTVDDPAATLLAGFQQSNEPKTRRKASFFGNTGRHHDPFFNVETNLSQNRTDFGSIDPMDHEVAWWMVVFPETRS